MNEGNTTKGKNMKTKEFKNDYQIAREIDTAERAFHFLYLPKLSGNKGSGFEADYGGVGEIILDAVSEGSGFQADIAKGALSGEQLSEKQAWSVAYAFLDAEVPEAPTPEETTKTPDAVTHCAACGDRLPCYETPMGMLCETCGGLDE